MASSLPPRWTWSRPDPLLTEYSTTGSPFLDPLPNALLYHRDEVHYDFPVPKSSYLAMHGNVSNILVNLGSADQEVEDDLDVLDVLRGQGDQRRDEKELLF